MLMSPPNILEFLYVVARYPVTATTVVCSILIQILCVASQKSFSFWGLRPQTLILLCPSNNPVRSTPLIRTPTGNYIQLIKWCHLQAPMATGMFQNRVRNPLNSALSIGIRWLAYHAVSSSAVV